jgi:16S rRNA G966 N2-methylase RsmD
LRHAGWIDAATLCIVEWEMAHAFFVPDGFECIDERHYGRVMISLVALAA